MPPRTPLFQCLKAANATPSISSYSRSFNSSTAAQASSVTQRRKYRDPYAIAQAKARKAANLSRQEVLKKERAAALGDPVRGWTTPYLQSFDTAIPPESTTSPTSTNNRINSSPELAASGPRTQQAEHLNFYLTKPEVNKGVQYSQWLNNPASSQQQQQQPTVSEFTTDTTPEERAASHETEQETATEALQRIASLSLGNSKDRLRANKQRCISDFGRHNTDTTLPPKPATAHPPLLPSQQLPATPRSGPDTGSSEVQIAILTAKIRTLADFLGSRGRMDKANKRNLRLLVHRRQKLLRYLRRKERGGPRWRHVVEMLGLTEGTWRGEITM